MSRQRNYYPITAALLLKELLWKQCKKWSLKIKSALPFMNLTTLFSISTIQLFLFILKNHKKNNLQGSWNWKYWFKYLRKRRQQWLLILWITYYRTPTLLRDVMWTSRFCPLISHNELRIQTREITSDPNFLSSAKVLI